MAKFEKGHTRGFQKGKSGNPTGKSKALAAAEGSLRDRLAELSAAGVSPVEIMLITMRDLWEEGTKDGRPNIGKRMQAVAIAEKVAPYVHPKLANTQLTGKDDEPLFAAVVQYRLPSNGRDDEPDDTE